MKRRDATQATHRTRPILYVFLFSILSWLCLRAGKFSFSDISTVDERWRSSMPDGVLPAELRGIIENCFRPAPCSLCVSGVTLPEMLTAFGHRASLDGKLRPRFIETVGEAIDSLVFCFLPYFGGGATMKKKLVVLKNSIIYVKEKRENTEGTQISDHHRQNAERSRFGL